jgi:DNA-binding response OmpR family regulator
MERLLVLDPSGILPWLVAHAAPAGVEVEAVDDLEEAGRRVRACPPAAVVVDMPPAHLPWASFQRCCAEQTPPVPVLYLSCETGRPRDAGLDPAIGIGVFLLKPVAHRRLEELLAAILAARRSRTGTRSLGLSPQPLGNDAQPPLRPH